jgi:chromosome segregation ATPase
MVIALLFSLFRGQHRTQKDVEAIRERQERLAATSTELERLQDELYVGPKSMRQSVEENRRRVGDVQRQVDESRRDLDRTRETVESHGRALDETKAAIEKGEAERERMKEQLAQGAIDRAKHDAMLAKLNERQAAHQAQLDAQTAEMKDLHAKAEEAARRASAHEKDLADVKGALAEQQAALLDKLRQVEALRTQADALQKQLDASTARTGDLERRADADDKERARMRRELDEIRRLLGIDGPN